MKSKNQILTVVLLLFVLCGTLFFAMGTTPQSNETGGAFMEVETTSATTDTINNNATADTSRTVINSNRYKHIYFTYRQNSISTFAKVLWDEPTQLRCRFSTGDTAYVIEKPGPGGIGWTTVPVLLPSNIIPTTGTAVTAPAPVGKIKLTVSATAGIISWYGRNSE